MPRSDLPPGGLESFLPDRVEPPDFDQFWSATLAEARAAARPPVFEPVATALAAFEVLDVRFSGFGAERVGGWLILPRHAPGPVPGVVKYLGYGGGRGFPFEHLEWAAAGYAQLVMDNRGQGGAFNGHGGTSDSAASPGPQAVGYSTRGISDPRGYVMRRLYADAVLAVDALISHPLVDPGRVAVTGMSLGGGSALAVAGLRDDIAAALIDVPALCAPRRAMEVVEGNTFREIWAFLRTNRHLVEAVFKTLSYVDGCNFAARATTPAFFSAALMDTVVPPSSVFAAYNHYRGPKRMQTWEFNCHEAGGAHQLALQYEYLAEVFANRLAREN
jgi:cephalosporin-C deacetylase